MAKDRDIATAEIGLAVGSTKQYYSDDKITTFTQHHACQGDRCSSNLKRKELFRLFAPIATCKNPVDRPQSDREIAVLIGSETLSIGQNLIQKLITRLGTNYQANPISIGHQTGTSEPSGLLALTLQYFGPNGEPIPDLQRQIFWNDLTLDREGFGNAIAMAVRMTEFHQTTSTQQTLACMTAIYQALIN